jgi:hypothetical protein
MFGSQEFGVFKGNIKAVLALFKVECKLITNQDKIKKDQKHLR